MAHTGSDVTLEVTSFAEGTLAFGKADSRSKGPVAFYGEFATHRLRARGRSTHWARCVTMARRSDRMIMNVGTRPSRDSVVSSGS